MSPEPLDRRGYKNQEDHKKFSSGKLMAYILIAIVAVVISTILLTGESKNTTETAQAEAQEKTPESNSSATEITGIEKTPGEILGSDSTLSPDQIQAEAEARNIFASVHKKQEKLIEECGCFTSNWDSLGVTIPDSSKCTYTIKSACGFCGTHYRITAVGKKEEWGTFEMTHKKDFRRVN